MHVLCVTTEVGVHVVPVYVSQVAMNHFVYLSLFCVFPWCILLQVPIVTFSDGACVHVGRDWGSFIGGICVCSCV